MNRKDFIINSSLIEVYDFDFFNVELIDNEDYTNIIIIEKITDENFMTSCKINVEEISMTNQWKMIFNCMNELYFKVLKFKEDLNG